MKSVISFFSSTRTTAILLFIFALSIAVATFIENNAGTETAQGLIYHAKWFELLFLLGVFNIVAVTVKRKLYRKEKLTVFVFHISFIIIIMGAAFTRYFGIEGIMPVREGQTTSQWYSSQHFIFIRIAEKEKLKTYSFPVVFSSLTGNKLHHRYHFDGHQVSIKIKKYFHHAEKALMPDPEGFPYMHLITSENNEMKNIFMTPGDSIRVGNTSFIFSRSDDLSINNAVLVFENGNGTLSFRAPCDVTQTVMENRSTDTLKTGEVYAFMPKILYHFNNVPIIIIQYLPKGILTALPSDNDDIPLPSAILMDVKCDSVTRPVTIWEQKDIINAPAAIEFNGLKVLVKYGPRTENLPFSIKLNDFILKRYPGSESPSWFESDVQLVDSKRKINRRHRIYMNHILKYKGYRFYQASYDRDEKGTLLSLNCDWLGIIVTYAGYILLTLGMVMSLLNKHSRFRRLLKKPPTTKVTTLVIMVVLLFLSSSSFARDEVNDFKRIFPVIDKKHAQEFGMLPIQDNGGRIAPLNTLSSEVLRKVARKESYQGQNPDQVMLGMLVYPDIWQHQPIIKVTNPRIQEMLGIKSKYASFSNFFSLDGSSTYTLQPYVEDAYRKKPAYRSKFDNEVIRTDERLNICYLIYTHEVLKVFPDPNDATHKWHSPVTAPEVFNADDSVFTNHILNYYFEEVNQSMQSGNWKSPGEIVKAITNFQKKHDASLMPSALHIKAEIFYNQVNIFNRLIRIYLLIGFLLLLVQFIHIFIPKFSIRYYSATAILIISVAFMLQTFGLALRWYISGHAPLSNGYEALSFIAWATILAGLIFSYRSSITISTTAILSALILQIAHLSWMDPQITNLEPVLKSYWLVIHVAVVTASYGFLGMGALLAAINLMLMFLETRKNQEHFENQINLLTQIIELTLIAGLYLLTLGAFLGGVWANESWGRYWGWDPKETWALVTIIVYAFILHMQIVPGLKGRLLFSIVSMVGFSSVIMTYFGVNYYFSGLHSYASGDPAPLPPVVYYSLIFVIILSVLAAVKQFYLRKEARLY